MFVKICGLKTPGDVEAARNAGADAIGVVFSARSPRAVTADQAREVVEAATGLVRVVVTNDLPIDEAIRVTRDLGAEVLQLHDYDESDVRRAVADVPQVWRATSVARGPLEVGAHGEAVLLLDSSTPGSGATWDLELLGEPPAGRWMLAGGLNPENVAAAIAAARPWGVDVSSGVEAERGVKDHDRIAEFVTAARAAN